MMTNYLVYIHNTGHFVETWWETMEFRGTMGYCRGPIFKHTQMGTVGAIWYGQQY